MAYRKPNIVNSQYVHIEQTPASIGHRVLASVIDYMLLSMYYSFLASLIDMFSAMGNLGVVLSLILALIPLLYSPICEQFFNGVTLGKAVLGIRVVMQNGEAVTFSSSFLRWVMEPIDVWFCFAGVAVMFCNKRNMRVGDMAAGTMVIKETTGYKEVNALKQFSYITEDYQPVYPFAADMTWGQINFINHTSSTPFHRNESFEARRNIEMLAGKIAGIYNVKVSPRDYNRFLCQIVRDYNYYTWHDNV